jgi:signal recognition particle subunit SRP54
MLASLDIYRPAAIDQLKTLSGQVEATWFPSEPNQRPVDIARNAIDAAKRQAMDVVILDTAGRLHIDDTLMDELKAIHTAANPIESLLVVDSMTGQDAVNVAKAFHDLIPVTGLILTKTDGDSRGGAALSIRKISGTPVKFLGVGEKIDALEAFHPDRVVSRILGMGDVLSLIEEAERKIDKEAAQKAAKKIKKGQFDLEDFRDQIQQMHNMGGLSSILGKLPGMGQLPVGQIDEKMFTRYVAIINSMTPKERRFPDIIKGSRKRRIAAGCGLDVPEVNRLLKQFDQMQKMMKKMSKPGTMKHMMRQLGGMKF